MTTYYIEQNNTIVLHDTDLQRLQNTLLFTPQYSSLTIQQTDDLIIDGVITTQEEYDEKLVQEEKARIQELYMTRGDFFDGTIRAFGADENDLLNAIQAVLITTPISDLEKKVALNNYKNALHFYRKHPLFNMLSDVSIPVSEEASITITSEQWDNFFDLTDKKNPEAYMALLPLVVPEIPEEEVLPEGEGEQENPAEEEIVVPPIEEVETPSETGETEA